MAIENGDIMQVKFPDGFLWGTSTSAHQVEGNNRNNQWWKWEKETNLKESGIACDHYNKYKEDIDLMAELGYSVHRFSIEWSRVEPKKGQFDEKEIGHYRNVINYMKEKGIKPIPMLHHCTNPLWFMNEGGWIKEKNVDYFVEFVGKIASEFEFDYWLTLDEPAAYAFGTCLGDKAPPAYLINGSWPQREKKFEMVFKMASNLLGAHAKSYETIHDHSRGRVSLAKAVNILEPASDSPLDKWSTETRDYLENGVWLQSLKEGRPIPPLSGEEFGNVLDFFGLNYFSGNLCYFEESSPTPPWYYFQARAKEQRERNYMGWWVYPEGVGYPEGIYKILKRVHRTFGLPIMVTSNGIGTDDDLQRRRFIVSHLKQIRRAVDDGVNVMGYMHWSFMDGFEWAFGFEPKCGLVGVDSDTLERIPRKSAYMYGEIAEKNGVGSEIEEKYLIGVASKSRS